MIDGYRPWPGGLFLGRYNPIRQIKVYTIDMRMRQMTVRVMQDFTIFRPITTQVQELSTIISYQVVDARRVSLEVERPLGSLFDYVYNAMRDATKTLEYDDFLSGGRAAPAMMQYLRGRNLEAMLGLEVLDVQMGSYRG